MDPDTLRWTPSRTRVIPERSQQNPWAGAIDVVRDHADFLLSLRLDCSYREEVEDWEVMVPPLPKLSATNWDWEREEVPLPVYDENAPSSCSIDPTRGLSDWFPISDSTREVLGLDRLVHPIDEPKITTRKQARSRWKAKRQRPVKVFTLDDNYELLEMFDRRIIREGGHWFAGGVYGGRRSSSLVTLETVDGHLQSITPNRAAWLLDHATLKSTQTLQNLCGVRHCIFPEHHRLRGS